MIPLNDLARSVSGRIDPMLRETLERVITSGTYVLGHEVEAFEQEFGRYLGVNFVTSVGSGTDALVIGLRSLGVVKGSKAIVVPNAGGYTTTALLEIGALPVFVDCDEKGRMDLQSLTTSLHRNPEVNCVVATHLYGLNSNIEAVADICESFSVNLLEDCAQATGAHVRGKKLGSFGDLSTFSFYPTKNLAAAGDAGAIATNSPKLAQIHRSLRQYGWSSRYEIELPFGTNSRMDELQAAVLRSRLASLDDLNLRRRQIWAAYEAAVFGSGWRLIGDSSTDFVSHLGILVGPRGSREGAKAHFEKRGVSTSVHYPILDYLQPGWAELIEGNCPNAEDLTERILTIPLFPELTQEEIDSVATALREISAESQDNV